MIIHLDMKTDNYDKIKPLGKKDIIVGIPSYKNPDTIKFVVETASKGLKKYFPDYSAVIMNSDGGSPDATREQVAQADVDESIDRIISLYSGIPGKGSAFRNIFEAAQIMGVKGVVVVDSDLRSITPEWFKLLMEPIINDEVDYITPLYLRHKYDGTITNNFVYPLTRSLYGWDVRQPIGGDFGFSGKLLDPYLSEDVWETDVAKYGIDIWMTTTAIVKGFRVGQAALGAKIHDAKDPSIFLAPMFREVVGTCFTKAGQYVEKWKDVKAVKDTPLFGQPFDKEPDPVAADYNSLIKKFNDGYDKFTGEWEKFLEPDNYQLLLDTAKGIKEGSFDITDRQWARLIFNFLVSFNEFKGEEELLLDSLTPLYFVKIAVFMNKSADKNTRESENMIIAQADTFLKEKDYLLKLWAEKMEKAAV